MLAATFEEIPPEPLPWLLGRGEACAEHAAARGAPAAGLCAIVSLETGTGAVPDRAVDSHTPAWEYEAVTGDEVLAHVADSALAGALARLSEGRPRTAPADRLGRPVGSPRRRAILGVKPATARVRLSRARRRLTQALCPSERSGPATRPPLPMEAPS